MAKAMTKQEFEASFPLADVTCGRCGAGNCLLYPNPGEKRSPMVFRPSTVCPNCSTAVAEALLRAAAVRNGYKLLAAVPPVFPEPAGDRLAEFQAIVPQLDDEDRRLLEEGWCASAEGSNCTADFGYDEDGCTTYQGKRPSFALALLLDVENFEAGRPTALPYWEAV